MDVKFMLKEPKAKDSIVFLFTQYKGVRFKYSLGANYKVKPEYWNGKRAITSQKELRGTDVKLNTTDKTHNQNINSRITMYEGTFNATCSYFDTHKISPTRDLFKEYFDKEYNNHPAVKKSKEPTLNEFLSIFLNEIETGVRKTDRRTNYKKSTVKVWKAFKVQFDEYQRKNKQVSYNDITIDFYDKFTQYYFNKGCNINTTGKIVKHLKTLMRAAKEKGYHSNDQFSYRKFQVLKHETDKVYLTIDELQKLYELELTDKNLEIARDVFLIGCNLAMRYSDYGRINKSMMKNIAGQTCIQLRTIKTGTRVTVPLNSMSETLLSKYDYNLPKTHEQKVNERIKKVCEMAGINGPTELTTTNRGAVMTRNVPKYEMVSTHTARRTGATNMYVYEDMDSRLIMKITGHKTERAFLRYLKLTDEMAAIKMMKHRKERHLKVV